MFLNFFDLDEYKSHSPYFGCLLAVGSLSDRSFFRSGGLFTTLPDEGGMLTKYIVDKLMQFNDNKIR